jgi:bacterioferritin-associated ferredoxin
MVICSCRASTDRVVLAAIAQGATTPHALAERCSAATRCGGCLPELERLLAQHTTRREHEVVSAVA